MYPRYINTQVHVVFYNYIVILSYFQFMVASYSKILYRFCSEAAYSCYQELHVTCKLFQQPLLQFHVAQRLLLFAKFIHMEKVIPHQHKKLSLTVRQGFIDHIALPKGQRHTKDCRKRAQCVERRFLQIILISPNRVCRAIDPFGQFLLRPSALRATLSELRQNLSSLPSPLVTFYALDIS